MPETRLVAIHQPNFLPWVGFFHKMMLADIFILLDVVPFSKNGYQNRVKIKAAQGEQWLTVPVLTKGRFGQMTSDVPINTSVPWQRVHLASLRTNYHRAPYYEETMDWLELLYHQSPASLVVLSETLLGAVQSRLGLPARVLRASCLHPREEGGSALLCELVQAVGGGTYLSGPSGRNYLDTSLFLRAGVSVQFQQFNHPVYPQLYGPFVAGLSIVDLLMNVGQTTAAGYLHGASECLGPMQPNQRSLALAEGN